MRVDSHPVTAAARLMALALLGAGAGQSAAQPPTLTLVAVPDVAGISFVHEYTRGRGDSIVESAGSGAAWLDYDVDGDVDVLLANGLPRWGGDPSSGRGHALFRNHRGGFRRAPSSSGVGERTWGNGVAVADFDNDGYPDLLVTAIGPDRLLRNNGDGTFSAAEVGVEDPGWGTSASFVDWDADGFLDLYVARYVQVADAPGGTDGGGPEDGLAAPPATEPCVLAAGSVEVFCGPSDFPGLPDRLYRNTRSASFEPWYPARIDPRGAAGFAVVASDCDDDLRPEIYVANDLAANLLYRRTREGEVEDRALVAGAGYAGDGRAQAGMAATAADVDGDGLFDLFVTNYQDDHNTLYHNFGGCSFEDATARYGLMAGGIPFMGWAALFVDLDGDGDDDLFVANGHLYPQVEAAGVGSFGQRNLLYANRLRETGVPGFVEVIASGDAGQPPTSSRTAIRGDYDDDGDSDILVTNMNGSPTLLRNDTVAHAPAIRLVLIGRDSNRTAYGTRIRVASGDVEQHFELRGSDGFQGSNDPRLLVFLPAGYADLIDVTWPNGRRMTLADQQPGRIVLDERHGVIARAAW